MKLTWRGPDGKPILKLPGRIVQVVQCPFDAEERAFYDALEQKTALTFNKVNDCVLFAKLLLMICTSLFGRVQRWPTTPRS